MFGRVEKIENKEFKTGMSSSIFSTTRPNTLNDDSFQSLDILLYFESKNTGNKFSWKAYRNDFLKMS